MRMDRDDDVILAFTSVKILAVASSCGHGHILVHRYSSLHASIWTVLGANRSSMSEMLSRMRVRHGVRADVGLLFRRYR